VWKYEQKYAIIFFNYSKIGDDFSSSFIAKARKAFVKFGRAGQK